MDVEKEKIISEGVFALIEKLGHANALRFIVFLGGQDDPTKVIRARREEDLEAIVLRIKKECADPYQVTYRNRMKFLEFHIKEKETQKELSFWSD
jgi:hypothetical protein